MNNDLRYSFDKYTGWRGWEAGTALTDADIQGALAVFVTIDPNVHKAILGVKGQEKTAWVYTHGEWRSVEARHVVEERLYQQAKTDAAKVEADLAAKKAAKA